MARVKLFNEDEVLDKAVCLFWHKGYNGTSMQDLVDGLGISRSSLYDTYTDKHTLYLKALERYQNGGNDKVSGIVDQQIPAKEKIGQLLRLIIGDVSDQDVQKGCFMVNAELEVAPHDSIVSDMVCKSDQHMEDAFIKTILAGQQSGEITTTQDAKALTRFFVNTGKGMRVSANSTTDKTFFDDIIQTAISVLG